MKIASLLQLDRSDLLAGAALAPFSYLVHILFFGATMPSLVLAACCAIAVALARRAYLIQLYQRVAEKSHGSWTVRLDSQIDKRETALGALSDADYAQIKIEAFEDVRTNAAQFLNLVHVAMRITCLIFETGPILIVWGALAFAIIDPAMLREVLTTAASSPTANIASIAWQISKCIAVITFISAAATVCFTGGAQFGTRFGFVNCFENDVSVRICSRMHWWPKNGTVTVQRAEYRP